ncbi:myristylated tegument protein [Testudinid alphaherpesvirus 3]|uniref:Myristylated tegument protein n=1 Tax=Testudinid alphaherpesvirus 3 TaxID=2560801 RepID=A0A0K1R175_9ALPH|nr:myristylated tegument protein [Testudinid alphaherpesvirus 3]AIU39339.1 myristylated tegument protein [Testudinid alphaherpesvirus 3]AIU39434.1 myristylated tegument protein [Testudinid alphaherpesvirus 3]AKI81709.1 myristylated tegument protein [Testudinid alphaherpesvirus 3]AKI81810.1 myristylated tegument protein [Testudinid alphaherpesvirus 3]AKV40682.1 UL11 tegument protein [Testudinid alphaherpesvirus 3]
MGNSLCGNRRCCCCCRAKNVVITESGEMIDLGEDYDDIFLEAVTMDAQPLNPRSLTEQPKKTTTPTKQYKYKSVKSQPY